MPGIASATGLISARVRPVGRPKRQNVQLSGTAKPAPFTIRPFASLFNPYPYGCSVLCNHPADNEAKDVVRRAKDTWATEGKALLLPEEMEMIRTSLLAAETITIDAMPVPEELFRKYTETDSRPLTPAPTLASGPVLTNQGVEEIPPVTHEPRERTTLVLDLRADSQNQENETLTWHALTLEPPPTPRKTEVSNGKAIIRNRPKKSAKTPSPSLPSPAAEICHTSRSENIDAAEEARESETEERIIIKRRGKKLRKRKCRRGSTYGQQTEVRDPPDPAETQVSQAENGLQILSTYHNSNSSAVLENTLEKSATSVNEPILSSSFLSTEVLKHLCRELDREKIETEFSLKRRIAFEEALRVKLDDNPVPRNPRLSPVVNNMAQNAPIVFSRQAARFEVLDSQSLKDLSPLDYLSRHVFITSGRKLIFGRAFNRFVEESIQKKRVICPTDFREALQEVTGKHFTEEQKDRFEMLIGDITEPLDFRSWCGVCAAVERLLCPLPQKDVDPPSWIERADFEALDHRLKSVHVDPKLASLLREIRDR